MKRRNAIVILASLTLSIIVVVAYTSGLGAFLHDADPSVNGALKSQDSASTEENLQQPDLQRDAIEAGEANGRKGQQQDMVRALIEKRFNPDDQDVYPISQLAQDLARLEYQSKQGDLRATRTIYTALKRCAKVPRTEEELRERLARTSHPAKYGAANDIASQNDFDFVTIMYGKCGPLPIDSPSKQREALERLVESGDFRARHDYVLGAGKPGDDQLWRADFSELRASYKESGEAILQEMIHSGDPRALQTAALAYGLGSGAVDKDRVTSLAFYLALEASGAASSTALETMSGFVERLTPEEVNRAQKASERILEECCT